MTEIVSDEKLITKYQKQFVKQLKTACTENVVCIVGYQGSSEELTVHYSEKFNFWFTIHESDNRYWNAFGFGRPTK